MSYGWDLDNDSLYDDFTGASGNWRYTSPGTYTVGLRVSDGDGGFAYRSSIINVADVTVIDIPVPPPTSNVPEPTSLALLGLALAGLGVSRKRKQ